MSAATPADVPRGRPRVFATIRTPSSSAPAVVRARTRDDARIAVKRLEAALAGLQGPEDDVDLRLALYRRQLRRTRAVLDAFDAALAADTASLPSS